MSTEACVGATLRTVSITSSRAGLHPMMRPVMSSPPPAAAVPCPLPPASSRAMLMRWMKVRLSQGFVMKSKAPACMPLTARSMLPHAVMSITGTWGRMCLARSSRRKPSSPDVASEKFMSISIRSGSCSRRVATASSAEATAMAS